MTRAPEPGTGSYVVGRDDEIRRIEAVVDAVANGVQSLVINGNAGIGKTALWREAIDRFRHRGYSVLRTRCSEEEMAATLVGVSDLFDGRTTGSDLLDPGTEPFVRGSAVLRELRGLAAKHPLVVAIDDIQWLDAASARALRFALRRLDAEPVALIATARVPGLAIRWR